MGFESPAIVELMGHQQIAGMVREESVFGTALLRVDVPAIGDQEAFTKYFNHTAIYSITPTNEATAKYAAEQFRTRAIQPWILPLPESPMLVEKIEEAETEEDENSGEFDLSTKVEIPWTPHLGGSPRFA